MYLKKLEIYGFKSFAERIDMTFGQGITGVVGPNGCGKSNIGDAVRWVLGEQNARVLRGGKMEDIIFGGTDLRKALAYCEVSLTFDNAAGQLPVDYHEVMITRRAYRSGESEYFLNKTACRLKDITNLFRDTGIGKEGYSLIGQGRIDEILSVRSEDRRNVFEEAAGISKYKARRQEAERRVENTDQNLSRADDILEELSSQLEPLAEQAETARRYIALSQELRGLELNDFLHRHDATKDKLAALENQKLELAAEADQAQQQEGELRSAIEGAQEAITSVEQEISVAREEDLSLTREVEAREGALNLMRERAAQFDRDRARMEQESLQMHQSLDALSAQEGEAPSESGDFLSEQRDAIAELETQVAQSSLETAEREESLEKLKATVIEGMNRLSDVQSAKARLTATREGLRARVDALKDSETLRQKEEAQLTANEADERAQKARQELENLQAQTLSLQEEAKDMEKEREEAAALLNRTQGALREANSRLKMLEQMERDYEGYANSVREVMRAARGDNGVLGVVAEALRVPKEYERAIDMALGGQLQHIICRAQEDAKRYIDKLRENRAGRATFLPLDAVRGRTLSPIERECLTMPGCAGVASELIEYDEIYRPVVENLLGRTVVATDLASGIAIMRKARHAFRLVTLEGDVMHSGGSMTGGSVQSRVTSLLTREREIGEYRAAAARLTEREAEAAARAHSAEEKLSETREALTALRAGAHEREIEWEREQSHRQHALSVLAERDEAHARLLLERAQIEMSLSDIDGELDAIERLAGGEEQTAMDTRGEIERLSAELAAARAQLENLREELTASRVQLAAAEREHEASIRDKTRREQESAALMRQIAQRAQALESLAFEETKNLETITDQEKRLLDGRAMLDEKQREHRAREIRKTTRQQELRALLDKLEDLQKLQTDLSDRAHRAEVQTQRAQADLENLVARIWDSYELTYAGAQDFAIEGFDPAEAAPRIDSARREIRAMGTVNTAAIEDYRAISERHAALRAQRDDLSRAREDLLGIIDDLTRKMEERFTEQFDMLNRNFQQTFRALFGGGRAELRLADERNPLSCGIDIVAQPPGKKLQLLSLLSGGERALTAIAILFAMLKAKPTPFCILDEIEAALDESNIAHFASFLAKYAVSTQFIVVTHRKGTMECCDALYGVAMQEKGVSSMVSVELSAVDGLKNIG